MSNRLTTSMREFTNLDIVRHFPKTKPRKPKFPADGRKTFSWTDLKNGIKLDIKCGWRKAENLMSQLWSQATELLSDQQSEEAVDDACVFVVRLFLDEKVPMMEHLTEMKMRFPACTSHQVKKICLIVSELSVFISAHFRVKLHEEATTPTPKLYKMPFEVKVPEMYVQQDLSILADMRPPSYGAQSLAAQKFSMELKMKKAKKTQENPGYDLLWLDKHVNPDLFISAIRLIESRKSNIEIQGELFDILGFDKFDEVQLILAHRNELIVEIKKKGSGKQVRGRKKYKALD